MPRVPKGTVGLARIELATSSLSAMRSNRLSYRPVERIRILQSHMGTTKSPGCAGFWARRLCGGCVAIVWPVVPQADRLVGRSTELDDAAWRFAFLLLVLAHIFDRERIVWLNYRRARRFDCRRGRGSGCGSTAEAVRGAERPATRPKPRHRTTTGGNFRG